MKNRSYLFEGVDGTGKTTLALQLAEQIGADYYYSPSEKLQPLREIADNLSQHGRYLYYAFGNFVSAEEIKELLASHDVVIDRYVFSTLGEYSYLFDEDLPVPEGLWIPDQIIYLTASPEELEKRYSERPKRKKRDNVPFQLKIAEQYERYFAKLHNVLRLDTSNRDPEEVVDEIREVLGL